MQCSALFRGWGFVPAFLSPACDYLDLKLLGASSSLMQQLLGSQTTVSPMSRPHLCPHVVLGPCNVFGAPCEGGLLPGCPSRICVDANADDTSWVLTCFLPLARLGCSCSWSGVWSLHEAAARRDGRQNWPSRRCCPGASRNITARSARRPWGVAQKTPKSRWLWSSSVMKICVWDLVCLLNRIVTYVLVKSFLSSGISVGMPGGRLSDQVARCVFPYSNR